MTDRYSARLGFWSSLSLAILGGIYLTLLMGYFRRETNQNYPVTNL